MSTARTGSRGLPPPAPGTRDAPRIRNRNRTHHPMTVSIGCRARAAATALTAVIALLVGVGTSTAQDAPENVVVARLNGEPITEADLMAASAEFQDVIQQMMAFGVDIRSELTQIVVELKLASVAAEAAGLEQNPLVAARLALARQRILYAAYVNQQITAALTDEAIEARFNEELAAFTPEDQVHAFHILVETEEEAKAIIAELNQGADFGAIARDRSIDPGSGPGGGDLDYIGRGQTVPAFEAAAFAMEVGTHSEAPVESQFGWHVIMVADRRPEPPPTLEAETRRIRNELAAEVRDQTVEALLVGANIELVPRPPAPEPEPSPPPNP